MASFTIKRRQNPIKGKNGMKHSNDLIDEFREFQRSGGMMEQEQTAETILALPDEFEHLLSIGATFERKALSNDVLKAIVREWQQMKTLSDKAAKIMTGLCSCGHERDMHYGERGQGGCDARFDNTADISCTCNGYMPKER